MVLDISLQGLRLLLFTDTFYTAKHSLLQIAS